jgi:hypothetical protein
MVDGRKPCAAGGHFPNTFALERKSFPANKHYLSCITFSINKPSQFYDH